MYWLHSLPLRAVFNATICWGSLVLMVGSSSFFVTIPPIVAASAWDANRDLHRAARKAIPDFSGTWFHGGLPGDSPPTGPGPVTNRSKIAEVSIGDYTNPILKPWAAQIVKERGDVQLSGASPLDSSATCWPLGMPQVLAAGGHSQVLQSQIQSSLRMMATACSGTSP